MLVNTKVIDARLHQLFDLAFNRSDECLIHNIEIPKLILVNGPTGIGKTYIITHLAKLFKVKVIIGLIALIFVYSTHRLSLNRFSPLRLRLNSLHIRIEVYGLIWPKLWKKNCVYISNRQWLLTDQINSIDSFESHLWGYRAFFSCWLLHSFIISASVNLLQSLLLHNNAWSNKLFWERVF